MKKAIYFLPSILLFIPIAMFVGCKIEPQIAREIFSDRTSLPPGLDKYANPKLLPNQLSVLGNKDPKGRVSVAVIDNGADYLHPQLFQQIKFIKKEGQLVGAGFDLMGNDYWPHPSLINPLFFALVAKSLENNQLQGVEGDPLEWIMKTNASFTTKLLLKIKAEPKLANSLIAKKWIPETLSAFRAQEWVDRFEKAEKKSDSSYSAMLAKGQILKTGNKEDPVLSKHWGYLTIAEVYDRPWFEIGSSGLPPTSALLRVEGADIVNSLIKSALQEVNQDSDMQKRLELFGKYKAILEQDSASPSEVAKDVAEVWETLRYKFATKNSISNLLRNLCSMMPETVQQQLLLSTLQGPQRAKIIRDELVRQLKLIEVFTKLNLSKLSESQRAKAIIGLNSIPKLLALFDDVLKVKPLVANYMNCAGDLNDLIIRDAGFDNANERRFHPYLSASSASETHGTHVSGIIARQSKKIDIVPVRVVTATTMKVPAAAKLIRSQFDQGFAAWISAPAVQKAIGLVMLEKTKTQFNKDNLLLQMKAHLDKEFDSNYLDFYFFDQIKKAVSFVGSNRVKIANMSLGTTFEKDVFNPSVGGSNSAQKNLMQFLIYEYFKFVLGKTIDETAKGTLFVIASGNDGKWIDGKSRSALPCDLSSSMMAAVEVGVGVGFRAPNNRLNNILCVGSIDYNGELSSFSNLPLTNVPFVLSYGESVMSTIKVTDCEGIEQDLAESYGELGAVLPFELVGPRELNAEGEKLCSDLGFYRRVSDPEENEARKAQCVLKLMEYSMVGSKLSSAAVSARCMNQKKPHARLSGTSMATPAVAGYVARQLVTEVNRKGLSEDQLYTLPEYSPANIIAMIQKKNGAFGGPSLLKDVSKIIDIKKQKGKNIIGIIKFNEVLPPLQN